MRLKKNCSKLLSLLLCLVVVVSVFSSCSLFNNYEKGCKKLDKELRNVIPNNYQVSDSGTMSGYRLCSVEIFCYTEPDYYLDAIKSLMAADFWKKYESDITEVVEDAFKGVDDVKVGFFLISSCDNDVFGEKIIIP